MTGSEIVLAENRKAYHDYVILEKIEAGIVLTGTEVKSAKNKRISISGSYAHVLADELWLVDSDFSLYEYGTFSNHKQKRNRKLLCRKKETVRLKHETEAKGLTLVPLRIYVKAGRIKVELALAKGKHMVDKRRAAKERDIEKRIRNY